MFEETLGHDNKMLIEVANRNFFTAFTDATKLRRLSLQTERIKFLKRTLRRNYSLLMTKVIVLFAVATT